MVQYASRRDKVSRACAANEALATLSKRTQAAIDSRTFSLLLPPIATSRRNYPLATLAFVCIALGAKYGLDDNEDNNRYHHEDWDFVKHAEIFMATHGAISFKFVEKLPTHRMVD